MNVAHIGSGHRSVSAYTARFHNGEAGWCDGIRISVDQAALTDALVTFHEQIHERIFFDTTDGQLLGFALFVEDHCARERRPVPDGLDDFISTSFECSRDAHESAATYLSIKQLSDGPTSQLLGRLPTDYLEHYSRLANVLDPTYHATHIQYAVGWAVIHYVFSSRLSLRPNATSWRSLKPTHEDSPSRRLQQVLDVLSGRGDELFRRLHDVYLRTCVAHGRDSWNFQSEADWQVVAHPASAALPVAQTVEKAVMAEVYFWLRDHSGVPVIRFPDEAEASSLIVEKLGQVSEIPVEVSTPGDLDQYRTETTAKRQGRAVVSNPNAVAVPMIPNRYLVGDNLFEKLTAFQIVAAEPPDHHDRWIFVGYLDTPAQVKRTVLGSFKPVDLLNWLGRYGERARRSLPVPTPLAFTFPIVPGEPPISDLILAGGEEFVSVTGGLLLGALRAYLCWYWLDPWEDCLNSFARAEHPARVGCIPPDWTAWEEQRHRLDLGAAMAEDLTGVLVKILTAPNLPGCVMRAFPAAAGLMTLHTDDQRLRADQLTDMSPEEFSRVAPVVRQAMQAIRRFWREF